MPVNSSPSDACILIRFIAIYAGPFCEMACDAGHTRRMIQRVTALGIDGPGEQPCDGERIAGIEFGAAVRAQGVLDLRIDV